MGRWCVALVALLALKHWLAYPCREKYRGLIDEFVAKQFLFYRQWARIRQYANSKGIKIIGDMPIYGERISYERITKRTQTCPMLLWRPAAFQPASRHVCSAAHLPAPAPLPCHPLCHPPQLIA